MVAGGRWTRAAAAGLLTVVALGACGDPNEGTAFAAEFGAYLDTQDAVVAHDSGGQNSLPYYGEAVTEVTLDPTLDEEGVVEAATAIVTHRPKTDISSHDVTILFSAEAGDAASPVVSLYVQAARPLPDTARTRSRLTGLVEEAKAWVPADPGLTRVTAEAELVTVETTSEPLEVAPALAAVLAAGSRDVRALQVDSSTGDRVSVEHEGDLSWLIGVSPFVAQARAAAPAVAYRAVARGVDDRGTASPRRPADAPSLTLLLPEGTDDAVVAALEALPAPAGVRVTVFSPRSADVEPSPTPSPSVAPDQ